MRYRTADRVAARAALLVVAAALVACESGGSSADFSVVELPALVAEADLRIGHADDPDIGFTNLYALDVDRDGLLYAGEALASPDCARDRQH